ncbi:MAG TPA: Rieske 2Fe-2S domain-containing protein [Amycolatopsis sp.]|uniref:Rieske 2Fe-2S domain-containing protein n=1 Tax=Amycolatopsis sp. TaxID=37632 RepID=UPI002B48C09B|nr:Rieske 2Fe-2S domain-containing protein [Amycolatopsis sp.]HKS48310.1 Rieske 2Fe-2S domain-containing protein [Amycolatopsis sp.]
MKVTSIGHAGFHIETAAGTVLCDPWVTPAYFASWFPFPDNSHLDWAACRSPDYLYISHLHRDHFDPDHLRERVSRDTTVLLPCYRTSDLENALRDLGFRDFLQLPNAEPVEIGGLRVMIVALVSPSDGPMGDSLLALDDGHARVLNQNDAKPVDFGALRRFGSYDAHFLQFSGANWWPVVYELPEVAKANFGAAKRANGLARAYRYVSEVNARYVVPSAGPPAFLDDDLMRYNDVTEDASNPFPDHQVFLRYLARNGKDNGVLMGPGSVLEISGGDCSVTHPGDPLEAYRDKARYLREYADRVRRRMREEKESWPVPGVDVLTEIKAWFEPLMKIGNHVCTGVGAQLLLEISDASAGEQIVVDFVDREVRPLAGEKCRYRFRIERPLVERLIADHETDWVNSLFLGMRFVASRIGPYNEFVYTFFKSLSAEKMTYVEQWYSQQEDEVEEIQLGGWVVQRRCPHRQADLTYFGEVRGDVLRCTMHGYEFDLTTGRCVTAKNRRIKARRAVPGQRLASREPYEDPED